eukprot:COSAG02_NODE_10761_length_1863_cov_1.507370_3_plen_415_part_01
MATPHAASGYYLEAPGGVAVRCDTSGCSGGIGQASCAVGYEGDRCSMCASNFYKSGSSCYECVDGIPLWLLGMLFVMALLVFFAALERVIMKLQRTSECAAPFMILLSLFQTLDLVLLVELKWPVQVTSVAKTLSIFNFNLQLARPECSVEWSFAARQALTLGTPLYVLIFMALFLAAKLTAVTVQHMALVCRANEFCRTNHVGVRVRTCCTRPPQHNDTATATTTREPADAESNCLSTATSNAWPQLSAVTTEQQRAKQRWATARKRLDDVLSHRSLTTKLLSVTKSFVPKVKVVLTSCMTVFSVFFLQPAVQGLDCIETVDNRRFLDIEPATECNADLEEYSTIRRRSYIGIAMWTACACIFAAVVIRGGQSEFAFLAQKMKPQLFWWELLLVLRKVCAMLAVAGLSSRNVEA